ncbi:hypothetical protein DEO72_LG3g2775 [Vigna unguiculata]|uniref:Epidermal patterning factor-like protein n=1 Tax=Vigna unguiculata TaxID=3917 RepID=A0A4D6LI57_VIGUN|nr:hypothetical protein DEO72_LG3g2775 [Vigna unguiculata]
MVNESSVCRNVFFLFLFCTLMFSSGSAFSKDSEVGESLVSSRTGVKRVLKGLPHPPNCIKKCEKCTPCTPVLVALPPPAAQRSVTAAQRPDDYVPQVWKCTCGGRYYNPYD